ncbi:MAG: glycosyltransferase [Candidatus Babeliales bacterium]|nr:glycosyltransferase [Candidatus Babeliales bacterium]
MKLEHKYSDGIFNKKIVIMGIEPPPLGGIAVHNTRVIAKFRSQSNLITFIDVIKETKARAKLGYLFYLIEIIIKSKPDIVYYHTLSLRKLPVELLVLVLFRLLFKYQLTLIDHTPRFFYGKSLFYKSVVSFLLRHIDKQVFIGDSTYKSYRENGIYISKNYSIESPYISPDFNKCDEIWSKYPQDLKNFIARRSPIVLINGSAARLVNGVDLYGFDMAIEMFNNLNHLGIRLGLIVVLAEIGDKDYFDQIYSKIKDNKDIYLLLGCNQEIWPIFARVDLFIRPTCSDAYGISIQEALDMNAAVIASNVCQRPEGTILFEMRNQNDLNKKAETILRQISFKNNICHEYQN